MEPGNEKAHFALWPLPDLSSGNVMASMLAGDAVNESVDDRYEEGLAAGRVEGRREVEAHWQRATIAVESAQKTLAASRQKLLTENERSMHMLAVAVARQIIQREVAQDPAIIAGLVRHALDEIKADGPVEVRVNPDDYDAITKSAAASNHDWPDQLQWVRDSEIERGGCIVEGDNRMIDGRLDTALIDLYHRLNDG